MVLSLWYSQIESHPQKVYTCKNLNQAVVQWQNMAIREYKNAKMAKSQNPQNTHRENCRTYGIRVGLYVHICGIHRDRMRSTYYPGVCTKPGTYYQGWFMYMRYVYTGTE